MSHLKLFGKYYIYTVFEFILLFFILNVFYYYDIVSSNWFKIFELIILIITLLYNSHLLGNKINNKRVLNAFVFSLLFIIPSFIACCLFNHFHLKIFIYYFIILFTSLLGIKKR